MRRSRKSAPPPLARRVLPLIVLAIVLLPSFALGELPHAPGSIQVPDCAGLPPGLTDRPALVAPLTALPDPVTRGNNVGALPGAGSVTATGEYTYRLPIEVPPGRAGMQPALALTYSSRAGNGHLGVGWQLDGLSEIARCPKTIATEGTSDGSHFDAGDALCLDGHKLIALHPYTDRTDGCAGTEYRTEDDIFARITSCMDEHGSPGRFTAWLQNGRVRSYTPIDVGDPAVRFGWLLGEERDRAGNAIRYSYQIGEGLEYYPTRIDYTFSGATSPPAPGQRSVQFSYDTRPDTESAFILNESSNALVPVRTTRRLSSIQLYAPSLSSPLAQGLVWNYQLSYTQSPGSGRSRLMKIQRCGGAGGCSQAKQFTWDSPRGPTYQASTFSGPSIAPYAAPMVLDLDGNGKDDVLFTTTDAGGEALVALTTVAPGFPLGTLRSLPDFYDGVHRPYMAEAKIADIDGDGRDEIIIPDTLLNNYQIYNLTNGSLFAAHPFLGSISIPGESYDVDHMQPLFVADLDGDGLPDLVKGDQIDVATWSWGYRVNQGSSFGPKVGVGNSAVPLNTYPQNPSVNLALIQDQGHHRSTIFPAYAPGEPGDVWGFRVESAATAYPKAAWATAPKASLPASGDWNGDGMRDPAYFDGTKVCAFLNQKYVPPPYPHPGGVNYLPPTISYGPAYPKCLQITLPDAAGSDLSNWTLQVADLDADGRDDFVLSFRPVGYPAQAAGGPAPHVLLVRLNAQEALEQVELDVAPPDAIGDFDGDGLLDLASRQTADNAWHVYQQTGIGTNDRMIASADEGDTQNPDHAREKVIYSTIWSPSPNIAQCSHPQRCMRRGFNVVREHDVYQGQDVVAVTGTSYQRHLFNYEDPRFDVHGRGFLGFGTVRHWEPDRVAETITTYDNATSEGGIYPYALRPKQSRRAVGLPLGNARLLQTDFTYELRHLNQGKNYVVYPSTWSSLEWEEEVSVDYADTAEVHITQIAGVDARTALRTRQGSTTHDDYGNVLDEGSITWGGVETDVVSTYDVRVSDWLIGLLATRQMTSANVDAGTAPVTRHVAYTHEARGLLCNVFVEKDDPSPEIPEVLTYFHDAEGLVFAVSTSTASETTRTSHLAYEAQERVFPFEAWNDLGHARGFLNHPGLGVPLAAEDENGVETRWRYDDLGRPVMTARDGAGSVTMQYSPRLGAGGDVVGVQVDVAEQAGGASCASYDELGRKVGSCRSGFKGSSIVQAVQYDNLGRVYAVSRPGVGAPSTVSTSYVYDGLDRLTSELRPSSETVTYSHTFFKTHAVDPMGHARDVERDVDGRVVATAEITPAAVTKTHFQYGDFGQVVRTTDPQGNEITVTYDTRGRRKFVDDPDAGLSEMHYDGFGELKTVLSNDGAAHHYHYDALGRLGEVDDPDGPTVTVWDLSPHGVGRPSHTMSPDGTQQDFAYTSFGQLQTQTWTLGTKSYSFDQSYDPFGRLSTVSYPEVSGRPRFVVRNTYNASGYLADVSDATFPLGTPPPVVFASLLSINDRNVDGRLTDAVLGDGEQLGRTYDPGTGRLLTINDGAALSLAYHYDLDGHVTRRDDLVGGRAEVFSYDALHRLSEWDLTSPAVTRQVGYGYDSLGNLSDVTVDGLLQELNIYGENGKPHALTSNDEGTYAYLYDGRGRQVQAPGRQVTFTEFDLPRTVTLPGAAQTSFRYDAARSRVKKEGPAGIVITLAGLFERRGSPGHVQDVFYVHGADGPVAQVVYDEGTSVTSVEYLHLDALGSVGAVTNAQGVVKERLYYEPFGARRDAADHPLAAPAKDVLLGFTGDRHDDDLGLIDMRGRVYDPALRRFLTPDPVVTDPLSGQSYNRYSYVVNNPVNLTDPTGFDWWDGSQGCIGLECLGGVGWGYGDGDWGNWGGGSTSGASGPAGTSSLKHSSGRATLASEQYRPVSLPVGPTALEVSILGPKFGPLLGPEWVNIESASPGFERLAGEGSVAAFKVPADAVMSSLLMHVPYPIRALLNPAPPGSRPPDAIDVANALNPLYQVGTIGADIKMSAERGDSVGVVRGVGTAVGMVVVAAVGGKLVGAEGGGTRLFHGTDMESGLRLLNGAPLDAAEAAVRYRDGYGGFHLATDVDAANYFGARRGGGVIQYQLSAEAVTRLTGAGAVVEPIPAGGMRGGFPGQQFVVPTSAFGLFNWLREAGHIIVTPL
jgi:RHS repeat-associated protein